MSRFFSGATASAQSPCAPDLHRARLSLFGKYHTLDLRDLDPWFGERTDSYVITDKVGSDGWDVGHGRCTAAGCDTY